MSRNVDKETVSKCMKMVDAGMKSKDIGTIVGYSHAVPTRVRNAMNAIEIAKNTGTVAELISLLDDRAAHSITAMVCELKGFEIPTKKRIGSEQEPEQLKIQEPESSDRNIYTEIATLKGQISILNKQIETAIQEIRKINSNLSIIGDNWNEHNELSESAIERIIQICGVIAGNTRRE